MQRSGISTANRMRAAKSGACFRHYPDRLSDTGREMRTRFVAATITQRGVHHRDQHQLISSSRLAERQRPLVAAPDAPQLFRKMQRRRGSGERRRIIFLMMTLKRANAIGLRTSSALQNQVSAVAPKLLYPTGRIQHAGSYWCARIAGTAMHQWPGDSGYTNLRTDAHGSALSAACLPCGAVSLRWADLMRSYPTAHSDLHLCFKVREAGMRCVYTPFDHDSPWARLDWRGRGPSR